MLTLPGAGTFVSSLSIYYQGLFTQRREASRTPTKRTKPTMRNTNARKRIGLVKDIIVRYLM